MNEKLPVIPSSFVDSEGFPRFGTYEGSLPEVNLHRLAGRYHVSRLRHLVKNKRWQYVLVATHEVLAMFAIVDLKYAANAFVCVIDLAQKKVVADETCVVAAGPWAHVNRRPGAGLSAHLRTVTTSFRCARADYDERYKVDVQVRRPLSLFRGGLSWHGHVLAAGGPPPLTVIAPLADGDVNVTQKWGGLLAFGTVRSGGRNYQLDGGVAGLDYTQGYLPRKTAWRWAFALGRLPDGTPFSLNLVEGFNDSVPQTNENALWIGQSLIPLGRARFEYNPSDLKEEWRMTTDEGAVDVRFRPIHVHREVRDYQLIQSKFAQPLGIFDGTVRWKGNTTLIQNMAGVTETQDVLW